MTVPLAEQIVEVEKEVRDRARRYPAMVAKGRLKPETADAKLAAMRAVQSTLHWLERNDGWIKAEHRRRSEAARLVAEHFPDAEIVDPDAEHHETEDATTHATL